jgi:hypothetical protein
MTQFAENRTSSTSAPWQRRTPIPSSPTLAVWFQPSEPERQSSASGTPATLARASLAST